MLYIFYGKISDNPRIYKISSNITLPELQILDVIAPFRSDFPASNHSNISNNVSDADYLNEYIKQFMIIDGSCDVEIQHSKKLNNNSGLVKLIGLEKINEGLENIIF